MKKDFSEVQKRVERYTLDHYKELGQNLVYDRGNAKAREKIKTKVHEQAMKARTGGRSRKEDLKSALHQAFERAQSHEELQSLAEALGAQFYTRGKSVGVLVRDPDGQERRHRLSTLGLMDHYQATGERLAETKAKSSTTKPKPKAKERDMSNKESGGFVWGTPPPTAPEIVIEEFGSGKLHPDWHGQPDKTQANKSNEATKAYSDAILKGLHERDKADRAGEQAKPAQKTPSKPEQSRGGGHER